jgi:protein SCO1
MLRTVFFKITTGIACIYMFAHCGLKKAALQLPYYNTPDFTPHFIPDKNAVAAEINHTIATFNFTDQNGMNISNKNVEGSIHVANFIFTRCGSICPVITDNMKLIDSAFKNNAGVQILSFSVTPWIDSVPVLKKFANSHGIKSSNWHFLTGNKGEIYKLARQSYFAEEDLGFTKDSTQFLHTEHILLVDKTQHIRGIYNGTLQLEIKQLAEDIKTLLQEE